MQLKRKGQSVTEYAILLGVAIAVFAGMQTYVKRGLNARIKKSTDMASTAGGAETITLDGITTQPLGNLTQYDPYTAKSNSNSYSESTATDNIQNGVITKGSNDVNVQAQGSSNSEVAGITAAQQSDAAWGDTTP